MNPKAITFKLTAWYIGIFLVSTIIIGLVFYWETKKELISQTDNQISLHARQIISTGITPEMPGMYVEITDKPPQVIFREGRIRGVPMRYGLFPAGDNGILVAHPIVAVNNALNRLIWQLAAATAGIGVLGISGGIILAKKSLQSVSQLADQMEKLSLNNLNQPVKVPGTGDEIASLARSFNRLLDRLSDSFNRERQFIGDVAHEIKTPLTTLISSIEVALTKNRSTQELKHVLSGNLIELNRLSATINDVLDLAWSQSGEISNQFNHVDMSSLAKEIVELTENLGTVKKINVVSEITNGITVKGIRQKLFRAIYNLADNAVKYTPVNGKVAISLRQEDGMAILEISNTGHGITPTDLPFVFKRFYRGKGNNSGGTGLGLSICKSIVEAHLGSIAVVSHQGKITTFTVKFPQIS